MNKKLFLLLCMMSGSLMAMQEKQDNLSTSENIVCAILETLVTKQTHISSHDRKELEGLVMHYMNQNNPSPSDIKKLLEIAASRFTNNK